MNKDKQSCTARVEAVRSRLARGHDAHGILRDSFSGVWTRTILCLMIRKSESIRLPRKRLGGGELRTAAGFGGHPADRCRPRNPRRLPPREEDAPPRVSTCRETFARNPTSTVRAECPRRLHAHAPEGIPRIAGECIPAMAGAVRWARPVRPSPRAGRPAAWPPTRRGPGPGVSAGRGARRASHLAAIPAVFRSVRSRGLH